MTSTASGRFVELDDEEEESFGNHRLGSNPRDIQYQHHRRLPKDERQHRKKSHYDKVLNPQPVKVCNPDDAYFARQYLKQQEQVRQSRRSDEEKRHRKKKQSRSRSRTRRKTKNAPTYSDDLWSEHPKSDAEDILGDYEGNASVLSGLLQQQHRNGNSSSSSPTTSDHRSSGGSPVMIHADTGSRQHKSSSPTQGNSGRSGSGRSGSHRQTHHPDPEPVLISPPETDSESSSGSSGSSSSGSGSSSDGSTSSRSSKSETDDGADGDTFDVDAYTTDGDVDTHAVDDDDDDSNHNKSDNDDDSETTPTRKQAKRNLKRLLQDDSSMTALKIDAALLASTSTSNLCKGISRNTSIVQLSIDMKGMKNDGDTILALIQALEYNDTIGSLSLSFVEVNRFAAQALSMFLFRVPSLAFFRLHFCTFRDKSAFSILCMGLQHVRKNLTTLHLEGVPLGLNASENATSAPTAATDMDLVSSTLPFLQKVTTLTVKNVQLSLSGWKFFLNILDKNPTSIEQMDLSQNKILSTKEGMHALVESNLLSGSSNSGGTNGDKDAKQVASPLKRLSLADCGLKRPAVKTLVQEGFLESTTKSTLTHLELSGNVDIDDRCCRYLLQLLTNTPSIATLGLEQCPHISKKYMRELTDQLRYNNSFFKTFGLSSDVSLAIMDGMQMLGDMAKK